MGPMPSSPESIAPADIWRRTLLVDVFKRRRGQVIGTAGKAAVSLRFDHGLRNFKNLVVPMLTEHGLPALQAMNPRNIDNSNNRGATWADCLNWWANYGIEFANHTATHGSAGEAGTPEGRANAYAEVVHGLAELEGRLGNQFPIELFTPAGGTRVGEKILFDGGRAPENFYDTYYGQLILQHHAATHGHVGGSIRPLPARNDIGLTVVGMDSKTSAAELTAYVDMAIEAKSAVQFMLHPSEIDKGFGFITTAVLEEVIAYLASQRDAGELDVLTGTGLLLADPTTDYRHDLLAPYAWGKGLEKWSGTKGWSTTVGPDAGTWAGTTTGGVMSRAVETSPYHRHYRGGNRELVVGVVAPDGAVVETSIIGSSGVISRTVTHSLPASDEPVTVRQQCALPMATSPRITIGVGRRSGGAVAMSPPRLITV